MGFCCLSHRLSRPKGTKSTSGDGNSKSSGLKSRRGWSVVDIMYVFLMWSAFPVMWLIMLCALEWCCVCAEESKTAIPAALWGAGEGQSHDGQSRRGHGGLQNPGQEEEVQRWRPNEGHLEDIISHQHKTTTKTIGFLNSIAVSVYIFQFQANTLCTKYLCAIIKCFPLIN